MSTTEIPDFTAVKAVQQQTWASADYAAGNFRWVVEALGEVWRTSLSPTAPLRGIHLIPDAPAGAAKP